LIVAEGARLLRDEWTGETPQAYTPRRLTAHPAESEHPAAKINGQFSETINGVNNMELVEIRQELEKTAKRLADFRGSL